MQKNQAGTYQFDLKETVQLFPNQLPIEEIEDMELIPQVEIEERGEEIDISGSLYLYGNYRGNLNAGKLDLGDNQPGNYEESVQFEPLSVDRGPFSPLAKEDKFEYRIPVRISLPKGKVRDISDVYAYISSFDYELKTPYQIEVLASLVIAGFKEKEEEQAQVEELEQEQVAAFGGDFGQQVEDQGEQQLEEGLLGSPFEFVHVAGGNPGNPLEDVFEQRIKAIEEQIASLEEQEKEEPEFATDSQDQHANVVGWNEQQVYAEIAEPRLEEAPVEEDEEPKAEFEPELEPELERTPGTEAEEYAEPEMAEERDNVIPLPSLTQMEEPAALLEMEPDLDKDVKVAISKKGTKQDREKITSLSSIFGKLPKADDQVEDNSLEAERQELQDNEALYLTNFMGSQEEQFTKVKICIIQKDESIEDIADRYKIQVETILRANQAARSQVMAGQILYIPVKG